MSSAKACEYLLAQPRIQGMVPVPMPPGAWDFCQGWYSGMGCILYYCQGAIRSRYVDARDHGLPTYGHGDLSYVLVHEREIPVLCNLLGRLQKEVGRMLDAGIKGAEEDYDNLSAWLANMQGCEWL